MLAPFGGLSWIALSQHAVRAIGLALVAVLHMGSALLAMKASAIR